jgi:hypothetical protein
MNHVTFLKTPRERLREIREEFPFIGIHPVPSYCTLLVSKPVSKPYQEYTIPVPETAVFCLITQRGEEYGCYGVGSPDSLDPLVVTDGLAIGETMTITRLKLGHCRVVKGLKTITFQQIASSTTNGRVAFSFYTMSDLVLRGV